VHVGASSLAGQWLLKMHGNDLRPGDAYLNNSPYHGNTHAADHTILVPVFCDDDLMFICLCRGHQADIGNSIPTTYHAKAKDVYEEGAIIFPCVKVQSNYKDNQDIIGICKMRIRVPEVWYGDYLAMIGAVRIGEQELTTLIKKFGKETIKAFCEQYQKYGKQRMIEEIKKLPAGTAYYETKHDPIASIVPNGVNVKVKVTVDPKNGYIICDFTDNEDSIPCGLNLCEATLASAARTGILNRLSVPDLPHCEGALGRIIVKMREGSVVGKAKHPYSSSVATTNVNDRAMTAVQCALNQITDRLGMAEPHFETGISIAVISGTDSRYDNKPYITQLFSFYPGGPGVNGHDGYLHHSPSCGGMTFFNSVEMIEQQYPVLHMEQEIITDGIGYGRWDGAPSVRTVIRPMRDPVNFLYYSDGHENPSRGAAGGFDGRPVQIYLCKVKNEKEIEIVKELPAIHEITLKPGEALLGINCSPGGYGDPLRRDPDLVRHRVREEWISPEKARSIYGVVLDTESELFAVKWPQTEKLRDEQRQKSGRD
jgi:N-methylhydantoinase B